MSLKSHSNINKCTLCYPTSWCYKTQIIQIDLRALVLCKSTINTKDRYRVEVNVQYLPDFTAVVSILH